MPSANPTPRPATARALLGRGNTKLGPILTWSIPALATCPGATAACRLFCYALRGRFRGGPTRAAHAANLAASRAPGFAGRMARAVRASLGAALRIHVAGDFYDAAYARKWLAVARACPTVTFFAYTRSWRDPAILPVLCELAAVPNVHLWFSEDRDTGASPAVPRVRVAFVVATAADEALVTPRVDLVFRERAHERARPGRIKRIAGRLICPYEQGWEVRPNITCATCRICFSPPRAAS